MIKMMFRVQKCFFIIVFFKNSRHFGNRHFGKVDIMGIDILAQ